MCSGFFNKGDVVDINSISTDFNILWKNYAGDKLSFQEKCLRVCDNVPELLNKK